MLAKRGALKLIHKAEFVCQMFKKALKLPYLDDSGGQLTEKDIRGQHNTFIELYTRTSSISSPSIGIHSP